MRHSARAEIIEAPLQFASVDHDERMTLDGCRATSS
jgi:hypothetical protein